MTRSVTVLGATGSIGRSTLDLVEREPERFEVLALTAHRDVAGLAAAARRTRAQLAAIGDEALLGELRQALAGTGIAATGGPGGVCEAAAAGADVTVTAIVGCAGLVPTVAAIAGGKTVVLANKEPLVAAGPLVLAAARASGATLLPADSEHNAIFQCFDFARPECVRRLVLTASGGPFRDWPLAQMARATAAEAVAHPNWAMGAKISVDSATLINKGLELIEAARLFPVPPERIEVVVHRQSVVHSLVDYIDGSMLAQLGPSDMRVPLAHCLAWPDRMATPVAALDLVALGRLEFEAVDETRFKGVWLARAALAAEGPAPAVLNAANEAAVAAFLAGQIGFLDIADTVEAALEQDWGAAPASVAEVNELDACARRFATARMAKAAA